MQPKPVLSVDEIDLSSTEFWARPPEEREGAFQTLRRERPMARFDEQAYPGMSEIPVGGGYWAVTRCADIQQASRTAGIFSSGRCSISTEPRNSSEPSLPKPSPCGNTLTALHSTRTVWLVM